MCVRAIDGARHAALNHVLNVRRVYCRLHWRLYVAVGYHFNNLTGGRIGDVTVVVIVVPIVVSIIIRLTFRCQINEPRRKWRRKLQSDINSVQSVSKLLHNVACGRVIKTPA